MGLYVLHPLRGWRTILGSGVLDAWQYQGLRSKLPHERRLAILDLVQPHLPVEVDVELGIVGPGPDRRLVVFEAFQRLRDLGTVEAASLFHRVGPDVDETVPRRHVSVHYRHRLRVLGL